MNAPPPMSEAELDEVVGGLRGETTEVEIVGQNDGIQLLFSLREYPPAKLWLGPHDVILDGDRVANGNQREVFHEDETLFIPEGDNLYRDVHIDSIDKIHGQPGLPQYRVILTSQ